MQPSTQFVLYESASGYSLMEVVEAEEIASAKAEVLASMTDLARFSKIVKLKAFQVSPRWVFWDGGAGVPSDSLDAGRCFLCVCMGWLPL